MSLSFLVPYATPIIGEKCSVGLFEKLQFGNVDCIKLAISKALGYGIVVFAAILKVPQIAKILANKSAKGVSLMAYFVETLAFLVFIAYNHRALNPFSTWGEGLFIAVQNLIVIFLILALDRKFGVLLLTVSLLGGAAYSLATPSIVSAPLLAKFQSSNLLLTILSKLPQIVAVYSSRSIGALSGITVFLQFAGTVARVFTTMQELKDDQVLIISSLVAASLNAVLFLGVLLFSGGKEAQSPSKRRKKTN